MIISVLNQKGGTGKTTLSVNLARCLTKKGKKTLLVDTDPQGSALSWHEHTNGELLDMTCLCKITIGKDILKYVDPYDFIIIDGLAKVTPISVKSMACSDVTIIPVQPSAYDIWSTSEIVGYAKDRISLTEGKFKAAFVVSRKIVNTNIGRDVTEELDKMELPVFKNVTCQRVAYLECVGEGLTVLDGKYDGTEACKEIQAITQELEEFCYGIN